MRVEELKGFEYNIIYKNGNEELKRSGFNKEVFSKEDFIKYVNDSLGYKNIDIIKFDFVKCVKFICPEGEIFNNEEEALNYIDKREKLKEANKIFHEKQNKREEEKNILLNKKEKYLNLYLDSIKNVMQKGRIKKVLYKPLNYLTNKKSEGVFERFIYLEKIKDSCFKTAYEENVYYNKDLNKVSKWEYRVYLDKDSFRNLTKIEYNYLNFIKRLENE